MDILENYDKLLGNKHNHAFSGLQQSWEDFRYLSRDYKRIVIATVQLFEGVAKLWIRVSWNKYLSFTCRKEYLNIFYLSNCLENIRLIWITVFRAILLLIK